MSGIDSNNSTGGHVTNATAPNIALGKVFGEERHKLIIPEMPSHTHSIAGFSGYSNYGSTTSFDAGTAIRNTSSSGGDQPHNNMQPSIFMKFYIRAK